MWCYDDDVLFSTSLGMPKKMTMLTRPIRIMGFLRMLSTETAGVSGILCRARGAGGVRTLRSVDKVYLLADALDFHAV
jgi:hypothetical protein